MNSILSTPFIERVRRLLSNIETERISKDHLVSAAVMLLLFEKQGEYHIFFNKRSQEVEHHKGEIAFPGGVYDEADADFAATALRETWEEMGIRSDDVTLLGQLSELETRTNFRIVPFVGAIPYPYPYTANASEVAQVLEVPIKHLLRADIHWQEEHDWLGKPRLEYFYRYQDHVIFGATARILRQFLSIID
ncbi:MAG: CoA pyrophosphatase [Dehalococcoidia bacterium]